MLRNSLSCTVCEKILTEPYTPEVKLINGILCPLIYMNNAILISPYILSYEKMNILVKKKRLEKIQHLVKIQYLLLKNT